MPTTAPARENASLYAVHRRCDAETEFCLTTSSLRTITQLVSVAREVQPGVVFVIAADLCLPNWWDAAESKAASVKKCSYCGHENGDAATSCVECGKELNVSAGTAIDPQLLDPALAPVIVATFAHVSDAGVLTSRLEAAGIEAVVPEEYTPQLFWNVLPNPVERVTVRVAAKDYESAKAIADEVLRVSASVETPPTESSEENPSSVGDATETTAAADATDRKICVRCQAPIPRSAELCPKCGWTQPG